MLFGLTAQFLYFMNWANCFPKCLFNCFKIIWCCGFDQIYIELELLALVIHNLIWNYQAEQTNTQHFPLFSLGQQYQTGEETKPSLSLFSDNLYLEMRSQVITGVRWGNAGMKRHNTLPSLNPGSPQIADQVPHLLVHRENLQITP